MHWVIPYIVQVDYTLHNALHEEPLPHHIEGRGQRNIGHDNTIKLSSHRILLVKLIRLFFLQIGSRGKCTKNLPRFLSTTYPICECLIWIELNVDLLRFLDISVWTQVHQFQFIVLPGLVLLYVCVIKDMHPQISVVRWPGPPV